MKKAHKHTHTYRSLSSAAAEASESLAEADAKRSSERSRSSSNNWIRRLRAATSDSACNDNGQRKDGDVTFCTLEDFKRDK